MNRSKVPVWIWAAILVPALLSLYGVYQRHRIESRNKAVSIVTEFETIEGLGAAQGMTLEEAVKGLKAQGLNGVVISEETIGELITRGDATLVRAYVPNTGRPGGTVVSGLDIPNPITRDRARKGLEIRFGKLVTNLPVRQNRVLLPALSPSLIRGTTIGLDPEETEFARKHNLFIVARHGNPPGIDGNAIRSTLAWSHELGATVFLPSGDQVLGRRDSLNATIDALRDLHLYYAAAEFGKIGGEQNVLVGLPEQVIRLHSAQAAELDKLPTVDAVERYAKAARERNMRILLVRPLTNSAEQPLDAFGDFIGKIATQVRDEGGHLALPHGFDDTHLPRPYFLLLGLSLIPAAYFTGCAFVERRWLRQALLGFLVLLGLACWVKTGQEIMGLMASLTFPVLAFVLLDTLRPKNVVLGFFMVTAISFVAGLFIAGLLNGRLYFIGADQPFGVKLGLFLPVLMIGWLFVLRLTNARETLKSPITWGSAGLGVLVLGVLLMLVARSGNDTGAGASDTELVFRSFLDRFLYVRPRTKEFMIGHPALIIGIGLLSVLHQRPELKAKLGGWTALALMLGAVGQTGAVNTLWHLHIPVLLSVVRIWEGAVIGCILGLVLWGIGRRWLPRAEEA